MFGYKYEDVNTMILPMARAGAEPSGAMGTDTPLAVLSSQHPPLFSYFKQRFAQVTNPPIDAIREKVVTSTSVYIGAHGNLLEDKPENCKVLKGPQPDPDQHRSTQDQAHERARLQDRHGVHQLL